MKYDILDKLSDPEIESKVAAIQYFIKRAKEAKSNEQFRSEILDFIRRKERVPYFSNYCLIGPKHALGCLIGHFLYHYLSVNELRKQIELLMNLLSYVREFQPSRKASLKKTIAVELIDTIKAFGLPEYFLRTSNNRPLRTYFIPYEHKEFNAGYYPHLNSIVSYKSREEGSSPEYIFVHEMGHLLIYNLTGDPEKVPDSFIEFNKKFNPSWDGDLVEVFVDLFSIAIMMDSDFASKNPFLTIFPIKDQKIVRNYFIHLVEIATRS